MRLGPSLLIAFLLLPTAAAGEQGVPSVRLTGGCPSDPSQCAFARASFTVGPFTITAELAVEGGSDKSEASVLAEAGDSGSLTFSLLANASTAGSMVNATLLVNETPGLKWSGETARNLSYVAQAGFPHRETFNFTLAEDVPEGDVPITFTMTSGNESVLGGLLLTVQPAPAPTPAAPVGVVAALVAAVALALRRSRDER